MRVIRFFLNGGCERAPGVYNMGGGTPPPPPPTSPPLPPYTPGTSVSRLQIAESVARRMGAESGGVINGVTRVSLPPGLVKSPADITMDSAKLTRLTGIPMKGLEEAVEMVTF